MTLILMTMLAAIIALLLLILGSVWFAGVMLDRMVGTRHRQLEEMMDTGTVPADWTKRYQSKMVKLSKQGASSVTIERLRRQLHRRNLRKLKQLIKYIQTTNLVENEETRSIYVRQLRNIQNTQI